MRIPKGFIKECGVYKRGNYIFDGTKIVKESTLLPTEEHQDDVTEKSYSTLEDCIRQALQFSGDIGQELRTKDIFINQVKEDSFIIADSKSNKTVAIITPDNNVYELKYTKIIDQDDTKQLKESEELADLVKDLPDTVEYRGKTYTAFPEMGSHISSGISKVYYCNLDNTPSGNPQESDDYFYVVAQLNKVDDGYRGVKHINFIEDLTEAQLPNISKFIYDLDKDKGNAWSVTSYTKNGNGDKIILVRRNGESSNTCEDIVSAVEEKYPKLKGEIQENKRGIWFILQEDEEKDKALCKRDFLIDATEHLKDKGLTLTDEELNAYFLEMYDVGQTHIAGRLFDLHDYLDTYLQETATEEIEEDTSDKVDVLNSTYFIRRPNNLDELKDKISKRLVTKSTYKIVDNIELSNEEYDSYTNNLRQDVDFLKTFRPSTTDADFTCIAVSSKGKPTLLIDNSSYDSAQYIGIA